MNESITKDLEKILVIDTGGSWNSQSDKFGNDKIEVLPHPITREYLERTIAEADKDYVFISPFEKLKQSYELTDREFEAVLKLIEQGSDGIEYDKVIVTVGLDKARNLAEYIKQNVSQNKTIIVTTSRQTIVDKAAMHSDVAFQLGASVLAARTINSGVYLQMDGKLYDPFNVSQIAGHFVNKL